MPLDRSITPPIDDPSREAQGYLAQRRAELERKAIDMAPQALKTLDGIMRSRSKRVSAAAKVSAARTVLEQAVGRPAQREDSAVQAGTIINVVIERFSIEGGAPTQIPIVIEARPVETAPPDDEAEAD